MATVTFFCAICGSVISTASPDDSLVQCPDCLHVVPVPAPVSAAPEFAEALGVFPEGVLALEVKFRCGGCSSKLQTDARYEGRSIQCPECNADVRIPIWSRKVAPPGRLTAAEIDFLSAPAEWLNQRGSIAASADATG